MNNKFQAQLNQLIDIACDNIEILFDGLGITNYRTYGKLITMCCPIHMGDNITALNFYPEGDEVRGFWRCRTHSCHKKFAPNLIGFIQGVLSTKLAKKATYGDAIRWLCKLFGYHSLSDIKASPVNLQKQKIAKSVKRLNLIPKQATSGLTREQFRAKVVIPADYYIQRGISPTILDKYDVGLYNSINRIVVPIYDNNYNHIVGFTGRSIYQKQECCGFYHHPKAKCPTTPLEILSCTKWRHSKGFNAENYLFNYWFAKDHIAKKGSLILVESIGNCLKLVQNGVYNVVASFGCHLTDMQELLLNMSGAMTVDILMDNDPPGIEATEIITKKLNRVFNIRVLNCKPYNDVFEMSDEEVKALCKNI